MWVVFCCCSDVHFPDCWGWWTSFHALFSHLFIFFGEMSTQTLYPYFNWFEILSLPQEKLSHPAFEQMNRTIWVRILRDHSACWEWTVRRSGRKKWRAFTVSRLKDCCDLDCGSSNGIRKKCLHFGFILGLSRCLNDRVPAKTAKPQNHKQRNDFVFKPLKLGYFVHRNR